MADLISFARSMGIIIDSLPPIGAWRRYRTDDHPRKRNGAIKYMGDHAFLQNWALDQDVAVWKSSEAVDMTRIKRATDEAERKRKAQQDTAAKRAAFILKSSLLGPHEYFKNKGFPDEYGSVWNHEQQKILVIPMRVDGRLVGCQLIKEDGEKKFLFGQRTSGAEYTIDNKGAHVLVEGYATALSVRAALAAMKRRYTIHVAFSAGNLVKLSKRYPRGFVVADNDASQTGEKAAQETGWPYFLPPEQGQDFNDYHRAAGLFKASMALHKAMTSADIPNR